MGLDFLKYIVSTKYPALLVIRHFKFTRALYHTTTTSSAGNIFCGFKNSLGNTPRHNALCIIDNDAQVSSAASMFVIRDVEFEW